MNLWDVIKYLDEDPKNRVVKDHNGRQWEIVEGQLYAKLGTYPVLMLDRYIIDELLPLVDCKFEVVK